MISVVIDTNIFKMSPYLTRPEWISLSERRAEGHVRLLVPDIVVMEAVEVVPRDWVKQRDGFVKMKVGDFGLQEEVDAILQTIQVRIDEYEGALTKRLSELGAEVVPVPEIPHLEVAKRASRGVAPYKSNATKDNYRDTLIWFTVLDVATKNPIDDVWFVSDNNSDFGAPASKNKAEGEGEDADVSSPWNQQLHEELSRHGLQDRVKYVRSLSSLNQHVSALYGPVADEERALLIAQINFDLLNPMFNKQLLLMRVPARDVALKPNVFFAEINDILSPDLDWKFSDEAKSGENDWTANWVVELQATVLGFSRDLAEMLSIDEKVLVASGTAKFTKQGIPQELEISRLEAPPNDPNRRLWDVLDQPNFGDSKSLGAYLTSQLRSDITLPPHILDSMTRLGALSGMALPPHILDSTTRLGALSGTAVPRHISDSRTKLGDLGPGHEEETNPDGDT